MDPERDRLTDSEDVHLLPEQSSFLFFLLEISEFLW